MMSDPTTQAIAELHDVVRCRCHKAYTDRGLRDPSCECDSADAVNVVESEITALRAQLAAAEADRLAYGERVRNAAVRLVQTVEYSDRPNWASQGSWSYACEIYAMRISTLKLDALAKGDE